MTSGSVVVIILEFIAILGIFELNVLIVDSEVGIREISVFIIIRERHVFEDRFLREASNQRECEFVDFS